MKEAIQLHHEANCNGECCHEEHNHEGHHHEEHCHGEDIGCGCGHDHSHSDGDIKKLVIRLIGGGVIFAAGFFAAEPIKTALFLAAYAVLAYDIVWSAVKNIFKGKVFDENLLMTVASIGAFLIGEHAEAAAVMLFYQIGEVLQESAVAKSKKSISELMDIRPDYANLKTENATKRVSPSEVKIGDIIVVNPGEKVPLDGVVVSGETYLDTGALTGESVPIKCGSGDSVLSGAVNTQSPLWIRVEKNFSESTVSKILDMVQYAQSKKAASEKFITTFAKYYTPVVVALAAIIMLIPSIITGDASTWIYRGLVFLMVSCPCALVVSVPLGFFAGIGCSSKNGILVKGSNYLESLAKLDSVVFDKTGTLTKGEFKVMEINSEIDDDELIRLAAYGEYYSNHPIAVSIRNKYNKEIDESLISDYKEIAGMGVSVKIDGKEVCIGNRSLVHGAKEHEGNGTAVHIEVDGKYAGYMLIGDIIKDDAQKAVQDLNEQGINTVMLTGDVKNSAEYVGSRLGIKSIFYQLLPQDKVARLEEIIKNKRPKKFVAFTGDGINDAPVLAMADVGIAMGGIGSDSAIEAADVVLMTDEPSKINTAIRISKRTLRIVTQNIVFALAVKVIIMILSAMGIANMWTAIIGDVGVALIAVLNSLRALKLK